ncbi:MAG: ABC transporter ATP-binding protein/permease [Clostridiales Family XIII bacterium]|jgi:ATP-binding cassette subfamily B protein|nr:ABC transporter ATP-binding protein/permease [Clostridiales Family XIII bacterium]
MDSRSNSARQLFAFAGELKPMIVLSCVLSAGSAVLSLMPFVCVGKLIGLMIERYPEPAGDAVGRYGIFAMAYAIAAIVLYFLALLCSHTAAFRVSRNMREKALAHLLTLPVGYFVRAQSGKLRKIIMDNSTQTETFLAHNLPDLCGALSTPVVFLVLIIANDWRLGLACVALMFGALACMFAMMGPSKIRLLDEYQGALESMNAQAVEYVRGIAVVKIFQQTIYSFNRFLESIMKYKKFVMDYALSCRIPLTAFNVCVNGLFAVLIPLSFLIIRHEADYGGFLADFIFFVLLTPVCAVMMSKIVFSSESILIVRDSLNRIGGILSERSAPEPEAVPRGAAENARHPGKDLGVEFRNVGFCYPGTEGLGVRGISFSIRPRQVVALVGPSGSGKSTIANLLLRFWDADTGEITVGGKPICKMATSELMAQMSFVFQDTHLFRGTLRENLLVANPSAADGQIYQALEQAQCGDIMDKLPSGLETRIGPDGVYLSGGEMQRISFARCILKNAPIVILDEATAYSDPENEHKMQRSIQRLTQDKTVLVIAHRLTTILDADEILVLEKGEVVERGAHQELLSLNGVYAGMWESYLQTAEWKIGRGGKC